MRLNHVVPMGLDPSHVRARWTAAPGALLLAVGLTLAASTGHCPALSQVASAAPLQGTSLTLLPASPVIAVGETVDVAVQVNDVAELWGADFFLTFDPTYVEVVDANLALPGIQIAHGGFLQPPLTMGSNTADNTAGTIWYGATQTNPTLPVSGSGPIAVITFRGLAVGYSPVPFSYSFLTDVNGNSIDHTRSGGGIIVQDTPVTLLGFSARRVGQNVVLDWETVAEMKHAGFRVLREESSGTRTNLSPRLLAPTSPGGELGGQRYCYTDAHAPLRVTAYWLEDVDAFGRATLHGPALAPAYRWWWSLLAYDPGFVHGQQVGRAEVSE